MSPTLLIVPGLRDHVPQHWQTLLAEATPGAQTVAPLEQDKLSRAARVAALDEAVNAIEGPVILVAHSAGAITVVHWAQTARRPIHGALLATPSDLERPLPDGYPKLDALKDGGWLPIPLNRLPFPSIVAASRNDGLCAFGRASAFAAAWGSRLVDLGEVGHLNPAAGYGPWPHAADLIGELQ